MNYIRSKVFPMKQLSILIVIIFTLTFICSGCAYQRKIGFSSLGNNDTGSAVMTVGVNKVIVKFSSKGTGKYKTDGLEESLQKRLVEILKEKNIEGILEGNTQYLLTGTLEINEKRNTNGLAGVSLPLAFLCGLGVVTIPLIFGVMAIPIYDCYQMINADITLTDTGNNAVLFQKKYEKSINNRKLNDYTGNPTKKNSKINHVLSVAIDDLFREIATDILIVQPNGGMAPQ